ncbi:hypothetical protein [uncultured Psychrobacter sp.]|uniref:hypothetical protein n=1 Tax=uncultured Psychrobacter sp. TaxID=259303 RepID=UPI00261D8357|nr:hypothetical protein [uncultured Psychrobacter sp.]
MPNSIRTTSNTQTTTNGTPATFKAGDSVLCPSVGNGTYQLFNDKEYGCLGFTTNGKTYHYRNDGKVSRDDAAPSLFHDTKANRQAIATLYSGNQTNQRTVIDITEADDNEVIVMSSFELSDIACDMESAAVVISDIGKLLGLIHYEKIDTHTAISMARLTHDTTETWVNLLQAQLDSINDTLAMTAYAKEVEK